MFIPRSSVLSTVQTTHIYRKDRVIKLVQFTFSDDELQTVIDSGAILKKETAGGWIIEVRHKEISTTELALEVTLIDIFNLRQVSKVENVEIRYLSLTDPVEFYEFGLPGTKNLGLMKLEYDISS